MMEMPKFLLNLPSNKLLPITVVIASGILIASEILLAGLSKFSPDSWSYFELAKTIFTDHFYQFNTYRSYISDVQSGSFPLGYPTILAVMHLFFGSHPLLAVVVNFCIAIVSAILVINIAKKLDYPPIAQAVLVISLLLYSGYTDEILSGRSIPAAILFFLLAVRLSMSSKHLFAGLMLGISVLMRFDFLVYAIFFQIGLLWFSPSKPIKMVVSLLSGFIIGLLPWVIYSLIYFDHFWFSDNSWVALSASPSYVLDYPAAATVSIMENPVQWCYRVAWNLIKLPFYLVKVSLKYPTSIILMCSVFWYCWKLKVNFTKRSLIATSLATLSLMPYVLTGYYDERYFAFFFLIISFIWVSQLYISNFPLASLSKILLFCLLITFVLGLQVFSKIVSNVNTENARVTSEAKHISRLRVCQNTHPNVRYIFSGDARVIACKYGALSGGLTAIIPSNFVSMDVSTKEAYFSKMSPYRLIDQMSEDFRCNQ